VQLELRERRDRPDHKECPDLVVRPDPRVHAACKVQLVPEDRLLAEDLVRPFQVIPVRVERLVQQVSEVRLEQLDLLVP